MENAIALLPSFYLPPISYFALFLKYDRLLINEEELYRKQSCRNRCYILSSQKVDLLTVPIKQGNKKIPINQVLTDSDPDWRKLHWRSIKTCYGKSPYFEYYADRFEKVYQDKQSYLLELNHQLLTICLDVLNLSSQVNIVKSSELQENSQIDDLTRVLDSKGRNYNPGLFQSVPYYQQFGKEFVSNLSILDLIMNEGPNSNLILKKSSLN
jgi:hypothetical protein